jgi:hypothetical protein
MHRAKVQGRALISAHIHASNAEGASYGYRCSYRTDAAAFADLATTAATVGLPAAGASAAKVPEFVLYIANVVAPTADQKREECTAAAATAQRLRC